MGTLVYGPQRREISFDDRFVAHLEVAMLSKLRRQEPFAFTWKDALADGSVRHTIWVYPSIPLEFVFDDDLAGPLNRAWIEELMKSANRGNLQVRPEPEPALNA